MNPDRRELIDSRLRAHLQVTELRIEDESYLHAGHPGARDGGGHFRVTVVSPNFVGENRVQRHRMVYAAIGDAMRSDTIHALSIQAHTPQEAAALQD